MNLKIEMEDATKYLPGDARKEHLQHFLYDLDRTQQHPLTGKTQRYLVMAGTLEELTQLKTKLENRELMRSR